MKAIAEALKWNTALTWLGVYNEEYETVNPTDTQTNGDEAANVYTTITKVSECRCTPTVHLVTAKLNPDAAR